MSTKIKNKTLLSSALFFFIASTILCTLTFAGTADDTKWIAQCMMDNKDQGQSTEIVQKYCECMNSKMDENETQSVTVWEKKHPAEQKECSEKAGWK